MESTGTPSGRTLGQSVGANRDLCADSAQRQTAWEHQNKACDAYLIIEAHVHSTVQHDILASDSDQDTASANVLAGPCITHFRASGRGCQNNKLTVAALWLFVTCL